MNNSRRRLRQGRLTVPIAVAGPSAGDGIGVVQLHNHALLDDPRLFYRHIWAHSDAQALARALRAAVDVTLTAS